MAFRNLAIDIETKPAKVYTFSLFKPVIGIDQIIEPSDLMCFSWQWEGSRSVGYMSEWDDGQDAMAQTLHDIMNEADAITTYNGKRFDQPWIEGILLQRGFTPPSPVHHIDLYQEIRKHTRLLSNKLDYAALTLLDQRKVSHSGFRLWRDCLEGDEKARRLMKKYSIQDTRLLIPLLNRMRPWIRTLPNMALQQGKVDACPNCASTHIQSRGTASTQTRMYRRYQCQDCGRWFRGTHAIATVSVQ